MVCSILVVCCACGSSCCCKLLGLDLQQFYRQIPLPNYMHVTALPSETSALARPVLLEYVYCLACMCKKQSEHNYPNKVLYVLEGVSTQKKSLDAC